LAASATLAVSQIAFANNLPLSNEHAVQSFEEFHREVVTSRKFMRKVPQTVRGNSRKDVRVPSITLLVIAISQEARTLPVQKTTGAPGKS
jgi:hypothetical protein